MNKKCVIENVFLDGGEALFLIIYDEKLIKEGGIRTFPTGSEDKNRAAKSFQSESNGKKAEVVRNSVKNAKREPPRRLKVLRSYRQCVGLSKKIWEEYKHGGITKLSHEDFTGEKSTRVYLERKRAQVERWLNYLAAKRKYPKIYKPLVDFLIKKDYAILESKKSGMFSWLVSSLAEREENGNFNIYDPVCQIEDNDDEVMKTRGNVIFQLEKTYKEFKHSLALLWTQQKEMDRLRSEFVKELNGLFRIDLLYTGRNTNGLSLKKQIRSKDSLRLICNLQTLETLFRMLRFTREETVHWEAQELYDCLDDMLQLVIANKMQLKHHVELLMSYDRAIIVYENNCESTLDMNDEDDLNISETEKQAKENLIRIKKEFGLESERLDNEIFRATKLRNVGLRHQLIKMSVMKAESARAQLNSMKSALQSVRKQISFRPSCTPITKIGDLMLRDIRTCSFSVDGSGNAISGGINNKSIYTSPETTLGLYPEYTGLSAISLADTLSGNTSTYTHSKSPCISNSNTTQPTLIISTPEFSPTSFGKDDTKPPPHYSTPAFYMDKISFTRKDDLELTMGLVNSDLLSRDVLISRNAKSPSQTHPSSRYPPRNFLPSKKTVSDYSPDNTRHYLSKPLAHASTSTSISPSPSTPSSGRAHHKANEMHSSYKSRSTDSSLYNGSSKMGLSATTVRTRSAAPITKAHNNANRSFGSIVGLDLYVPRIDPGSELNSSSQNISYFRPGSYSNDCANADLRRSLAKVAEDESFGHFYGHRSHNHPTPRMKNQPFKIYAQNTFTSSPPPAHGRFETCVTSNIANHTNNMKKSSDFVDTPLFVNEGTSSKATDPQTPSTISPSSSLCVPGERAIKDIFSSFSHQSTVSPQETAENDSTIAYNVGCAKSFSFPCDDPATDTSELHKKYTYETDSYHRSAKLYSSSETFVGDHV